MNLVVGFDRPATDALAMVGGKGHNLIHLGSAGFPVPPGFVVTAAAYRLFAESTPWLAESLDEFAYASAERLRGQCAALRARLAEAPLPLPVAQAVREAMRRLDGEETKAFAVRLFLHLGRSGPSRLCRAARYVPEHSRDGGRAAENSRLLRLAVG